MSDSTQDPTPAPAKAVSRWRVGSLSVVQIALIIALLVAVNYLASLYFQTKDASQVGDFSLSERSLKYLHSDAVRKHKDPIRLIVAMRASATMSDRVRALAEDYSRHSGGKITIKLIDPVRNLDEAQKLAATYGMYDPANQQISRKDLVIIDARSQEQIDAATKEKKPTSANVRIINTETMLTYKVEAGKQRTLEGFQAEDLITAGLMAAIEGTPRKVYFLADKSRMDTESANSPWRTLEKNLALQNLILEPINIAGLASIPQDAAGVALVAPKYDFTPEEIFTLESYWDRPKSALIVLLKPDDVPDRLRAFLRANGVTPRRDRVITVRNHQTLSTVHGNFTEGVSFLGGLAKQSTILDGVSSSLEVRENAGEDQLSDRQIHPLALIQAAPEFWGETKFGQGKETFDALEDKGAPIFLAAGVTRGSESDDRFADQSSRMLVMSNTDFLDPSRLMESNVDFLASSVNWLVGREEMAGVGPRLIGKYRLPMLDAQAAFINRINLFFLPAFVLVIAGFVWSSRRA
ncbi:Gldg family protein [Luteolibacter ambystomatis]|uniref:Gldg family protein n=1 Tax=Luteolibacter ambystomatis TaxID=2824561 RepID=A0A975IXS1_9BACT|nr:Gldg family protein [Luteolibacter ambystomatis]QUE49487.1 Gldg family protein [Luteolibacter ambystomatis]